MNDLQKDLFNTLYEKYGSMTVSKKQAGEILGAGISTLDRLRADGKGPTYKQAGVSNVKYNLHSLVTYIISDEIKTAGV